MAAYAALASLMNLIDQIHHHPQPPITLDKEQTQTLTEKIAFLQDFLEAYNRHYSNKEVDRLRIRIADAAYAAEDVIESHIVDQILARKSAEDESESSTSDEVFERRPDNDNKGKEKCLQKVKQCFGFLKRHVTKCNSQSQSTSYGERTSSADLYQSKQKAINESTSTCDDAEKFCCANLYHCLQKVLEEMDFIKGEVEEIREKLGAQENQQGIMTTPALSPKSPTQHNVMVGFDDVLTELLHKLTGQPHSHRQVIPISGMGGIGKTTLAKNLHRNPLVEHYFHVLAWVTISQEYNIKEILLELLLCQKNKESRESLSEMSEVELGEKLYKSIYGRRYFIVLDDIWTIDVWEKVKLYFPSNNEGSRIIVTTRLSNVASYLSSGCGHEMDFLDEDNSWSLFCKTVFGEEDCPPELKDIGINIAKNCKGLPLSIVVLGGLLAQSKPTRDYWAYILQNVSSLVNLEDNERYFKILHTSYIELPVHLKTCFLYMGIFPEDSKILVSQLIGMWVAEGFLKPVTGKSLEESAEEYLIDLIDRNLILVDEFGYSEKIKVCHMHDLLRDLCIREAQKERFVFFANQHDHEGISTAQRRIVIDQNISDEEYLHSLHSASAARSLICYSNEDLPLVEVRLLRVLKIIGRGNFSSEDCFQQVNLRYFAAKHLFQYRIFLTSISLFWNLQTLIFPKIGYTFAPFEIWKMPLLRKVECMNLKLPDPPSGDMDGFVLHNLHMLSGIVNMKFGEEVVKRIPNVKKLKLRYEMASDYYCLNNLGHMYKLECLECSFPCRADLLPNLIYPHSLKELFLSRTRLSWEDINTKIGSLPRLQSLELSFVSFTTSEWETIQGRFCNLKYLYVGECEHWENWTAESTHFPRLEHLALDYLPKLKEIPCDIGNIPTLKSIHLGFCSYSAIISAKQIAEEQEELGNEDLQVTTIITRNLYGQEEFQDLANHKTHNFQVKCL